RLHCNGSALQRKMTKINFLPLSGFSVLRRPAGAAAGRAAAELKSTGRGRSLAPWHCLRDVCLLLDPGADAIGTADAVIDDAARAAAADGGNVRRRRVEGIVHRAVELDTVGQAVGGAAGRR